MATPLTPLYRQYHQRTLITGNRQSAQGRAPALPLEQGLPAPRRDGARPGAQRRSRRRQHQLAGSSDDDVIAVLYLDGAFASRSAPLRFTSLDDGIRRIYSWQRLDEVPLVILVGLAEGPILEPVERAIKEAQQHTLTSTVIVLLLAGSIAALLVRTDRDPRSLHDSEQFLGSIVKNLPAMQFIKDAEDRYFVKFNKAGEELLGCSRTAGSASRARVGSAYSILSYRWWAATCRKAPVWD